MDLRAVAVDAGAGAAGPSADGTVALLPKDAVTPSISSPRQSFWNVCCNCVFSRLPDEMLLFHIFSLLSHEELMGAVPLVCTRWRFLAADRLLWRKVDFSRAPLRSGPRELAVAAGRHGRHLASLKLCGCTRLGEADVGGALARLPLLEDLHLCNLPCVTDTALLALAGAAPARLRNLSLFGCARVTDRGVREVVRATAATLRELSLRGCALVTDRAVELVGPALLELNVGSCPLVTDEGVAAVARRCPRMRRLNLHAVPVTNSGVAALADGCPDLRTLHLSAAPAGNPSRLTDPALAAIGAFLPRLACLNLQGCGGVGDRALARLFRSCPLLERVNLSDCFLLADDGVADLAASCPLVTHLSLFRCFKPTARSARALLSLGALRHLDVHSCVGGLAAAALAEAADPAAWPALSSLDVGGFRGALPPDRVTRARKARPRLRVHL